MSRIALIEPFFSGSHQRWVEGLKNIFKGEFEFDFYTLPGRHWKWRMHGGAVSLAELFLEKGAQYDLIIASDMLDLSTFLALTRRYTYNTPVLLYFHENQLTYPWSPQDRDVKSKRDNHYAFINYSSALSADLIAFNSVFHKESFLTALPTFLKQFPDKRGEANVELIKKKSVVLPLGLNLTSFDNCRQVVKNELPLLIWNHRWEFDKNPELFFDTLIQLKNEGVAFQLAVFGGQTDTIPKAFEKSKTELEKQIVHWGEADFKSYAAYLWKADILPVTAIQDFFGGSVIDGIYCECTPILPDRLAYPEHIPDEFKSEVFYSDNASFYELLKNTINRREPFNGELKTNISKYDWNVQKDNYRKVFTSIIKD